MCEQANRNFTAVAYLMVQPSTLSLHTPHRQNFHVWNSRCLGGAAVRHRTRDRKVAGLTPGRGAIKSTGSTQPSSLLGW